MDRDRIVQKLDLLKDKYSTRLDLINRIKENHERVWKFEDDTKTRLEHYFPEDEGRPIQGVVARDSEVFNSDPVRKKLNELICEFAVIEITERLGEKIYENLIQRETVTSEFPNFEAELLKFRTSVSNGAFHYLERLVLQPRSLTAKAYECINNSSKEQICKNLLEGYAEYAVNRNSDEKKGLISSVVSLNRDFLDGKVNMVEFNVFWK
jgi:hypothetical protein